MYCADGATGWPGSPQDCGPTLCITCFFSDWCRYFRFRLVCLAPALVGVGLGTFVRATVLGIIPATLAYSFVGAGLKSVVEAQESAYTACRAAGRADCHLVFDMSATITPRLFVGWRRSASRRSCQSRSVAGRSGLRAGPRTKASNGQAGNRPEGEGE